MRKVKYLFVVINIWRIEKVAWYIQCGVIHLINSIQYIHLLNVIYCVYIVKNHKTIISIHQIIRLSILLCVATFFHIHFVFVSLFSTSAYVLYFFYSYYKLLSLIWLIHICFLISWKFILLGYANICIIVISPLAT